MQNSPSLLVINDLCGYGKVATTAMLPILSYMGIPTFNLPTALVSNNLEYGKFSILETTDYIKDSFRVWKELGFTYDAIATGFMASEQQARIIAAYCREQALTKGTAIYVDPIMGDEGKLYNGISQATISAMRQMISVAHLCFPNYTEACYLTDTSYHPEGITREDAFALINKLRQMGSRSVLITSIPVDGKMSVVGYNASLSPSQGGGLGAESCTPPCEGMGETFLLTYEEIPVRIPGTGDIFSALVIGNLMNGMELKTSTRRAMDIVSALIDKNKEMPDRYRGIPLERFLNLLY